VATLAVAGAIAATVALLPGPSDPAVPGDPLAAAAEVAASQEPVELDREEFIYRRSETWRIAAPDLIDGFGSPTGRVQSEPGVSEQEVWLNYTGGGETVTRNLQPEFAPERRCSSGDVLVATVLSGFGLCPNELNGRFTENVPLFDERLGMPRELVFENRGLASVGDRVDELPTEQDALARELDEAAEAQRAEIGFSTEDHQDPEANEAARKLETAAEVLANPTGSPELRAAVFEYAGRIDGISSDGSTTDPLGRKGASVSLVEPARSAELDFADPAEVTPSRPIDEFAKDIDLSETFVRRDLIFDPQTSDVLATRDYIVESSAPELATWLESEGTPLLVEYTVHEPTEVVERPDLVLERVLCADGSYLLRRADRGGDCAGQLHPSLEDDARRLIDDLRAARSLEEEARLEAELEALSERSDALNFANPQAPKEGDEDTVIDP